MKNQYYKYKNRIKYQIFLIRQKYQYNFIFVHINKTGGSSIEKSLGLPLMHTTALENISLYGRSYWDKKYTFTVVRNPWDKVVSQYCYRVKTNQKGLANNKIDFNKWVLLTYKNQDSYYYNNPKYFMPQVDWFTDEEGIILVDFICRFEKLSTDFKIVCDNLNIDFELPHIKKSNRSDYQGYYNRESKNIIRNWFRKDIEYLNYKF